MNLKLRELTEGSTRLLVPEEKDLTRKSPVFYNPEMELSRDISIGIVALSRGDSFCDLLAASGARGVRVAKETGAKVLANDVNPVAADLIARNARLNDVDIEITNKEGNLLLSDHRFDFIDVDPFGSPVFFMDAAIRSLNSKGVLAVTATDTAALCGTSPRACLRKYDALPLRTDYYNELALRILTGFIARTAVRHEKGLQPVFSHCTSHYFRSYARVVRGRGSANRTLRNIAFLQHCFKCLWRGYSKLDSLAVNCSCGEKLHTAGPLWTGPLADAGYCSDLAKELNERTLGKKKEALKLVETVKVEQDVCLPYYNVHKIARSLGIPVRPMNEIINGLQERGYNALRTHFSGLGLRTDAGLSDLIEVISHDVK